MATDEKRQNCSERGKEKDRDRERIEGKTVRCREIIGLSGTRAWSHQSEVNANFTQQLARCAEVRKYAWCELLYQALY